MIEPMHIIEILLDVMTDKPFNEIQAMVVLRMCFLFCKIYDSKVIYKRLGKNSLHNFVH
jgi:hypothetical protein